MFKVIIFTKCYKCIFASFLPFVPKVGEMIIVKEGYCSETVETVTYNCINQYVEIMISDADEQNEYETVDFHNLLNN